MKDELIVQARKARLNEIFNQLCNEGKITSQKEFADVLGFNRSTVSSAMNGNPTYLSRKMITKAETLVTDHNKDTTPTSVQVPLLPASARGGSLADFSDGVMSYDCEYIISPVKDATFALHVTGESMSPEYPNGSIIFVKKIDDSAFVEWGKVYVLDTVNGAIIKEIAPTGKPDTVQCVSLNPRYQPFTIETKHINGWYRVLLVMCMK